MKKVVFLTVIFLFITSISFGQTDSVSVDKLEQLQKNYSDIKDDVDEIKSLIKRVDEARSENKTAVDSIYSNLDRHSNVISQLTKRISNLSSEDEQLRGEIALANSNIDDLSTLIDSVSANTSENTNIIERETNTLDSELNEIRESSNQKIASLGTELSNKSIYLISGLLLTIILCVGAYLLLRKRISSNISELDKQLIETKQSLEKEGIKLDNKLVEVLNKQLKLMDQEKPSADSNGDEEDHSLALKVADEISRMKMNLNHMDPDTKGIKRLDRAVRAIVNNFNAKGYEIPKLLNKDYNTEMNMVATMEPDDSLDEGEQIIKRIIKPQVNYNGEMIQAAEVVVAIGE
ncbi:MAG: hypothetical protein ACQETL_18825 [Bacteroidota bacterium]